MTGPRIPILTHPKVNVTMDINGYIVIRWWTHDTLHNVNYHVTSHKRVGWTSAPIRNI